MKSKRGKKSNTSTMQRVECFKIWLKDKGLEGNLTKDKFPKKGENE